jgi:hypothetical protein
MLSKFGFQLSSLWDTCPELMSERMKLSVNHAHNLSMPL